MLLSECSCASFLWHVPRVPTDPLSETVAKVFHANEINFAVNQVWSFLFTQKPGRMLLRRGGRLQLSFLTLKGFEFMYNIPTTVTQVPSKKIFWKKCPSFEVFNYIQSISMAIETQFATTFGISYFIFSRMSFGSSGNMCRLKSVYSHLQVKKSVLPVCLLHSFHILLFLCLSLK